MQHAVLITGAGKIGTLIAALLSQSGDYLVHLADITFSGDDIARLKQKNPDLKTHIIDVTNEQALANCAKTNGINAMISCLPYYCNVAVASVACQLGIHYFDLTEDVSVTAKVKQLAAKTKSAFVPQCGLAPGFISIAANSLMQQFERVDTVKMRVGALPQYSSNALHYALTWSTDGVINEYANVCHSIENGQEVLVHPLEGLESIEIDGQYYEAFNTSGGLGSLPELYSGKIRNMNYKTIRYPGHCEKMRFLMQDLRLDHDRPTLKKILEAAIPKTYQDVVVIYVSVNGTRDAVFEEINYVSKVMPLRLFDINWSAIQITTASGICAVVDLVFSDEKKYQGLVYQEQFSLQAVIQNRFGRHYLNTAKG